ncbi:MAG: thioredoxin [Candidatus Roizmanbacteria bacterium]|nr:thioredoxin [Candidatus Roizmanbacteria bacterium]
MQHITDPKVFEKEVLKSEKPVIVDFYADWCGPCRVLAPTIEELDKARKDILVVKVNVDEAQDLAMQYRVMSIPTVLLFNDGKVAKQFVGVQSKNAFEDAVAELKI